MTEKATPEIMTLQQAAAYVQLTERTVRGLAQRGEIPCAKLSTRWRFSKAALDTWIAGHAAAGEIRGDDREARNNVTKEHVLSQLQRIANSKTGTREINELTDDDFAAAQQITLTIGANGKQATKAKVSGKERAQKLLKRYQDEEQHG